MEGEPKTKCRPRHLVPPICPPAGPPAWLTSPRLGLARFGPARLGLARLGSARYLVASLSSSMGFRLWLVVLPLALELAVSIGPFLRYDSFANCAVVLMTSLRVVLEHLGGSVVMPEAAEIYVVLCFIS